MQVGEALLQVLACYLAESLSSAPTAGEGSGSMPFAAQIRAEAAAAVAILLCLALGNTGHFSSQQRDMTDNCTQLSLTALARQ